MFQYWKITVCARQYEYAHDRRWKGVMKGRNSAELSSFSLEPHQILQGPKPMYALGSGGIWILFDHG